MAQTELIKIVDLHKSFGKLHVLQGVSETIRAGEAVSIIGPSGGEKAPFCVVSTCWKSRKRARFFLKGPRSPAKRSTLTAIGRRWAWCFSISMCFRT